MTASHRLGDLLKEPMFLRVWLVGGCGGVARWLEMLVVGVLAFELTGSPFLVALLVILRMAPLVVFGPVVGIFADRLSPRLLLGTGLAVAAVTSAVLLTLFLVGAAQYWQVAVATVISGLVWTTDMPVRRRVLGDIAGQARIAAAMGLDGATNNATRMLGPLLGGVIYQWLGPSGAFALTTLLYGLGLLLVLDIRATVSSAGAPYSKVLREFQDAIRLVLRDGDIRRILMVTIVFNVWGFPFVSMIPVIGADDLALSAGWVGGLAAMEGAGAFVGALVIAMSARPARFHQLYYFGTLAHLILIFAAGWMTAALPLVTALFCIGLAAAGFATMQSTLIYSVAPPEMRGRMFGVLVLCIGTGLIGFANVGLMGEWYGGSAAIRIIAAEGLIPLLLIGIGWRRLWRRGGGVAA